MNLPSPPPNAQPPELVVAAARLDRAIMRLRKVVSRPEAASVPIPALGRPIDVAKAVACAVIAEQPPDRPATVSLVAHELSLEHSSASRLLGECAAEGLVDRRPDPGDRRRTIVTLTAQGREVAAESVRIRTWVIGHVLELWPVADVEQLAELLERLEDTVAQRMPQVIAGAFECFDVRFEAPSGPAG